MTYKELKAKGMTCQDYIKYLMDLGYTTVMEVLEDGKSNN